MAITRLNNNSVGSVSSLPSLASLPSGLGGKVLQVVSGTSITEYTVTNSGANTCANYALTITPSSTSSKILINMSQTIHVNDSPNTGLHEADGYAELWWTTGTSTLVRRRNITYVSGENRGQGLRQSVAWSYLHSPNSTSAQTYTMKIETGNGYQITAEGTYSGVLMEIAG